MAKEEAKKPEPVETPESKPAPKDEQLSGEISDLLYHFDGKAVEDLPRETPKEEAKPAEVPVEEPVKEPEAKEPEKAPEPEKKPGEEPAAETPEKGEPTQPPVQEREPESEPAEEAEVWEPPSREEYTNLLATMNELAGRVGLQLPSGREIPKEVPKTPTEEKPAETPEAKATPSKSEADIKVDIPAFEPIDFKLTEDTLYELTRDPKKFNDLLNKVMMEAHNRATQAAVQNTLRSIPKIIGRSIQEATTVQKLADDFYKENNDLVPYKQFVMLVTNEVAASNPGKGLPEILPLVADETRKKLNLKKKAVTAEGSRKIEEKKPAFVTSKGTRRSPAPKLSKLEAEINDLI